jgi:hypothetical protein
MKNDQEALIRVPIEKDFLNFSIIFVTSDKFDKPNGEWKSEDETVKFVFTNWNNPLGTAVLEPTKFGNLSDGRKVYFQLSYHYVSDLNAVSLYFLIDDGV